MKTNSNPDIFDRVGAFFRENPERIGWLALGVGVLFVAAAIFNWNWLFASSSYNTDKIEGIANMYGRGFARLWVGIGGVGLIIIGIVVLVI